MARRKITIEDLARMVKEGFYETRSGISELEKWVLRRFDMVDADLKSIKKQLSGVVYRP